MYYMYLLSYILYVYFICYILYIQYIIQTCECMYVYIYENICISMCIHVI